MWGRIRSIIDVTLRAFAPAAHAPCAICVKTSPAPHSAMRLFSCFPVRRAVARLSLCSLMLTALAAPSLSAQAPALRTWQEQNDFKSGPTPYEPLMKFWYDLDAASENVSIKPLTRTLLGRPFTLVTVSRDPITNPQDALRSGKTIVLIANAVHGNEPAGKEASQLVARDLVFGDLRPMLDSVIVLFVPLINPDGGEVRRRTNEEGFDMNRDYVKLESQEIHALVTQVMNEWTPDIHIDTHHGGSAPYTLTWQATLNPAVDAQLRAYPYREIMPKIRAELQADGYDGFDYSGAQTRDGVRGWGSTSVEPRKHHVYTGMSNSIGLLFETPSSSHRVRNGVVEAIPQAERYFHQVRGQELGMRAVIRHAWEKRADVRAVTTGARARAIAAGASPGATDSVVVDYELVSRGTEPVWMRSEEGASSPFALQNVPVWLKYEPTRHIARARGYVLPASIAKVVPLLMEHGIRVHRFVEDDTLELEVYDALGIERNEYFQGHYLKSVMGVEKTTQKVAVPAGWYYVSTAQSKGNLISYLLEPETNDNLITWGYTDNVLRVGNQKQRVPMMREVREQPKRMLEVTSFNESNRTQYWRP